MTETSPLLFTPLTMRGVTINNRVAMAPMCQYSSDESGKANDWHKVHLASRAVGGTGLIMVEATAVTAAGRISALDLGLWDDAQIAPLADIVSLLKSRRAVTAIQLAHAGRKASCADPWASKGHCLDLNEGGWEMLAPSAIAFNAGERLPKAMTQDDINQFKQDFVAASKRAVSAGFDVIEIHAAHGYLLHSFLSPLSNQRDDNYGGSLANRMRLLLELTGDVRAAIPKTMPLWVRISATDWVDGGWDIKSSVELAKQLKRLGVDLIDVSSGGLTPDAQIPVGPGYQVPLASQIKKEADIATGAVGLITQPEQAEAILQVGDADLVLLARALLRDPYWALRAQEALETKSRWPKQYGTVVRPYYRGDTI